MNAHYFEFSRNWHGSDRLCGACNLRYDEGRHIEITMLKPYTRYVCPVDSGLGHSSCWTGAYWPVNRTLNDHLCICGREFVEEDSERWRLTFELQDHNGHWHPVERIASRHATNDQHEGLRALIQQGEPIRNVKLEQIA